MLEEELTKDLSSGALLGGRELPSVRWEIIFKGKDVSDKELDATGWSLKSQEKDRNVKDSSDLTKVDLQEKELNAEERWPKLGHTREGKELWNIDKGNLDVDHSTKRDCYDF